MMQYEEALRCFQNALGIDPQIPVAFRDEEELERFIREGGSEAFIRQEEQRKEKEQSEIDTTRLWQIQNEAKLQRAREEARIRHDEEEAKARVRRQEESQRMTFNDNL